MDTEHRGRQQEQLLLDHGIINRVPTIRSSDFGSVLSDPFRYYLRNRLGLGDPFRYSQALSHGSWFHAAFEYVGDSQAIRLNKVETRLGERLNDLQDLCIKHNKTIQFQTDLFEREAHDARSAAVWLDAVLDLPLQDMNGRSLREYLMRPNLKVLGHELTVAVESPITAYGQPLLHVAQFDRLDWNEKENTLWVRDPKTTSISPLLRALKVPIEFQTQHYLNVLSRAIPMLVKEFGLPEDVRVGGMSHIIVRKPTIRFGRNDRDPETGVPDAEIYRARVTDWYLARGQYESKAAEWHSDPPINISTVRGQPFLEGHRHAEYMRRVEYLERFAAQPAWPTEFLKNPDSLEMFGQKNPYADFYLTDVEAWPQIIAEKGWIQSWRDPHNLKQGIYL
jgi:hypothetical protein